MPDPKSVRLSKHQADVIEDMQERGEADTETEALRRIINAGIQELGYKNGERTDTRLKYATNRAAWLFAIVGVLWMAFTLTYPVAARLPAMGAMLSSLASVGLYRVLDQYEPRVSQRLASLVGGEPA